jgi:microsomal prostaglandin-E synthase 2
VTLYEYPACPFCSKVKAFCDYYNIVYTVVSVNPVSRKEIEFSKSKQLPLIVVDGQKIQDSSLVVSVLKTSLERGLNVSECLQFYPLVNVTTKKGENTTEHTNKYFIMYGEQNPTNSLGELREEREWRQWVDDHLMHCLPPNIYRTLPEARQTMAVVSAKSSMTSFQRFLARNVASIALYFVGKRNAKKYDLKADVRTSLYDYCNQWAEAIGSNRQFMGGATPNLADLAVYGAINATEGLDTFRDIHTHTAIGPWYSAMKELVNRPRSM